MEPVAKAGTEKLVPQCKLGGRIRRMLGQHPATDLVTRGEATSRVHSPDDSLRVKVAHFRIGIPLRVGRFGYIQRCSREVLS